ncbi:MAG: hypothetical protein RSF39_10715 [Romboutsia sp.]
MLKNWNLTKHIFASIIISTLMCVLSCVFFKPSNAHDLSLLMDGGRTISLNIETVYVAITTFIALLLTLFSYIPIKNSNK